MKNGKVFAKLQNDKRVKSISVGENSATVILAEGFYAREGDKGVTSKRVENAKQAHAFIRSAIPKPKASEGHHIVFSMMTGLPVEIADGTPGYCDPSRESYWSM